MFREGARCHTSFQHRMGAGMSEPWRKRVVIGDATLYLGDCLEILPYCPMVDVVITDPPYSDNTHQYAKTNRGIGHGVKLVTFDSLTTDGFVIAMRALLRRSAGWVIATCDYRHAYLAYDWPEFVRLGVWVKPNPMPQISADRPAQGFEIVLILHSGKTPKRWNRGGGSGVWSYPVIRDAILPTQKPIQLINALISDFTVEGQLVADPFMGSGTVGVSCLQSHRRYIGIEQDADRFAIACERIENAQRQVRLFDAPQPKAQQEEMPI